MSQHLDQLLKADDSIVIVVGRNQVRAHAQGFGLSGCQLEMLSLGIERLVRALVSGELADYGSGARLGAEDGPGRRRAA